MNARTCLFGLVLVTAARPAGACSTVEPRHGLTVLGPPAAVRTIAADGVIAFDALARGEPADVALARLSLTLTPDDGGPAIIGALSYHSLGREPYTLVDDLEQLVLVWRPAAPLAPGAYTAAATLQIDLSEPDSWDFPVVVSDVPAAPLSPPPAPLVLAGEFDDEQFERVCCEVAQSSCGDSSVCQPTRVRVVPGLTVEAALAPADLERAYLWIAPWDGQTPGAPFGRVARWFGGPDESPYWSAWPRSRPIRLPDAAGTTCVVVGATSLIDGSTALADPICHELAAAHEEARTPEISASSGDDTRECLGPLFYEDDGRPYPSEPAAGCRVGAAPPSLAALLLLVARRRRRART